MPSDAVDYLASLPKPLSCISLESQERMIVGVWAAPSSTEMREDVAAMLDETFREPTTQLRVHVKACAANNGTRSGLLRGR